MKTFKKLLSEVAEPQAGDEINFKKKHIIQRFYDPAGNDDAFTGNVSTEWDMVNGKRFYNHADYKDGEDEDIYEDVNENTMPNNIVHALADRHAAAATHHKNKGNYKGYAAHAKISNDLFDAALRAGSHMPVRTTRLEKQSDKAWREHPMPIRNQVSESEQLDELSSTKLKSYMRSASDDAAKSNDSKKIAKRTDGVLKASEKIKEAHSHPLYDMHGLEDEDVNNDGIVDEKDAAMKRARDLLTKKRYYLEDVANDETHIINHNSKKQYKKLNAITAARYKLEPEKIAEETEQLDEISINLKQKYYDKSNDAKRAAGYGYSHKNDDGTLKSDREGKKAFNRMKSMNKVQDELRDHKNPVTAKVHDLTHLKDDGDVYDHTQTSDKIKDGDVLKLHGGRAGVMVRAWPVVTHGDSEHLHKVKEGSHISTMDKGRYKKSFEVASKHATVPELKESVNDLGEDGAAYAIGMSKAKEIHKDEPPLRKKTIKTAHKIAKAIIGESDENCNCYHVAGSEDSHHIENLKSLAPNSKISDGIAKVSREDKEAIAYMDKHFPSLHEDVDQLDEAMKLDRINHVYHDSASEKFAKEYAKAHRGNYRSGGPTEADEKASEAFHSKYDSKHLRSGYGGSGETVYTSGSETYHVNKHPNGKGFHGTDHRITKLNEDVDQLDELSKSTLKSYANRAMNDVRNSNRAGVRWAHSRGAHSVYDGTPGETEKKQARIAKNRENGVRRVINKLTKESLDEAFSAGSLKLDDGSYVTVNKQDAALLNQMFKDLNPANKKKMEKVLMTDKHGFQEILGFAREAL